MSCVKCIFGDSQNYLNCSIYTQPIFSFSVFLFGGVDTQGDKVMLEKLELENHNHLGHAQKFVSALGILEVLQRQQLLINFEVHPCPNHIPYSIKSIFQFPMIHPFLVVFKYFLISSGLAPVVRTIARSTAFFFFHLDVSLKCLSRVLLAVFSLTLKPHRIMLM